jgi:hypothetical protein
LKNLFTANLNNESPFGRRTLNCGSPLFDEAESAQLNLYPEGIAVSEFNKASREELDEIYFEAEKKFTT